TLTPSFLPGANIVAGQRIDHMQDRAVRFAEAQQLLSACALVRADLDDAFRFERRGERLDDVGPQAIHRDGDVVSRGFAAARSFSISSFCSAMMSRARASASVRRLSWICACVRSTRTRIEYSSSVTSALFRVSAEK